MTLNNVGMKNCPLHPIAVDMGRMWFKQLCFQVRLVIRAKEEVVRPGRSAAAGHS